MRNGPAVAPVLVRACHPEPTVAVTAFATILAATAGDRPRTCALVGAAVLAGQLVIGWSNDRLDAVRDAAAGRRDKPVATGALGQSTLDRALGVAALATVVLSLTIGWRAGLANLWVVGWGVAYNVGLKATAASWVPYALAFGALPAVATLAAGSPRLPGWWAMAAGACLGVTGNLTNALPDLVDDARTGVRGLPHRLGAQVSLVASALLLVVVTVLVVVGAPGPVRVVGWLGLGVVAIVVVGWLRLALRAPASRLSFLGIMGITAVDLALLVATGSRLK